MKITGNRFSSSDEVPEASDDPVLSEEVPKNGDDPALLFNY